MGNCISVPSKCKYREKEVRKIYIFSIYYLQLHFINLFVGKLLARCEQHVPHDQLTNSIVKPEL